jgi:hypothetical protein
MLRAGGIFTMPEFGEFEIKPMHPSRWRLFTARMDKTIDIVLAWQADDDKARAAREKRGDKESLFEFFGSLLDRTAVFYAGFAWAAVAAVARLPVNARAASAPSPSARGISRPAGQSPRL